MERGACDLDGDACPVCGVRASVFDDVCDLCLADLGEHPGWFGAAAPPPAASGSPRRSEVRVHRATSPSFAGRWTFFSPLHDRADGAEASASGDAPTHTQAADP